MSFLAPLLLGLGLAVAVPIIIHLFQRHQGPRLVFPALRYLRRAEREHARQIRLRQLLLLALRAAAVLLIALAAARPFLAGGDVVHEPTAAVIVLDNSLSSGLVVGDRRVLDLLKDRALETLRRAEPGDRFWLLRAGRPEQPALSGEPAELVEAVRATTVSPAAADLGEALRRASAILASGAEERAREIHLLSDLQATALTPQPAPADAPPIVVWSHVPDAPPNRSIVDVSVGGGVPPRSGERSTIAVTVVGPPGEAVPIRLVLAGRVRGATTGATGAAAVLSFPAHQDGLVTGRVEIDPDALSGDDRRYFVSRIEPPPGVALASRTAFLEDALEVLAEAGRIRTAALGAADVVVAPSAVGAGALHDGRAVVVLPPGSPLELAAANRRLADAGVPWRLEASELQGEARFDGETPDELLRSLAEVRVRTVYRLRPQGPAAADSVLLRLSDGEPWAIRGTAAGGGRYIVIGSPLTPEASTAPVSAAMLPLVDRLVTVWPGTREGSRGVVPGERVRLPDRAETIQRPDGETVRVEGGAGYNVPAIAGIYAVRAGTDTLHAFAVNPDPRESDLTRLGGGSLRRAFDGWDATFADDAGEWERATFRQRRGSELWSLLLLAALLVLIAEALVGASGRSRSATGEPSASAAPTPPVGARAGREP